MASSKQSIGARVGAAALAVMLVAACGEPAPAGQLPAAPAEPLDPFASCWTPQAEADCSARVEESLIGRAGGRVERVGDTLWVRPAETSPLPFVNQSGEASGYIQFVYAGAADELGVHIVRVSFYEGGTFALVDARTGNQTDVFSPPRVAPGGSRFATAGLDLVAGYGPNGIQIWSVTPNGPRLEWTLGGGESWGADAIAWRSDDALEFTKHTVVPGQEDPEQTRMRLTLGPDRLSLQPIDVPQQ